MRMNAAVHRTLLLSALVLVQACGGSAPRAALTQNALPPGMTIEQFLRAANEKDLDTMASLFGTRDGPVTRTWSAQEVDDRMYLLAEVLRHSDYTIQGEQIVPGRRDEATRILVALVIDTDTVQVPFTLVRSGRVGHWLIEDIPIDRVTRGVRGR